MTISREIREKMALNFKYVLKRIGLKNKDLAEMFQVSTVTVSRWLTGMRAFPIEVLYVLHKEYGINANFILTGEGDPLLISEDILSLMQAVEKIEKRLEKIKIRLKELREKQNRKNQSIGRSRLLSSVPRFRRAPRRRRKQHGG